MRLHLLLLAAGCDAFNVPHHALSQSAARRASLKLSEPPDPEHEAKVAKALKAMTGFANSYCKNTETSYCSDASIPSVCRTARPPAPRHIMSSSRVRPQVVIKGLAEHKVVLGAPLCPCRHYEDKQAEAKDGYWNCPCVPMRERHECHCM